MGPTATTFVDQLAADAELVAHASHLSRSPSCRPGRHGPLVGWVVCHVDTSPGRLGLHEVVARVTGRSHRRTAQAEALKVVRACEEVVVHEVHRCGCMLG